MTSVVHLSEICNILEGHLPTQEACTLEKVLLLQENITVKEVSEEHYLKALAITEDQKVGANDALAYVLMKEAVINILTETSNSKMSTRSPNNQQLHF